jgi:hypothetical protein
MCKIVCNAAVLIFISAITGCVPMGGSYYSPSGAYGVPVSEYCHGGIGAKNTMDMKFGGMELVLSADQIDSAKMFVGLQIFGNAKSIGGFDPNNISVYDEDNHVALEKENIKQAYSKVQANYSAYSFDINAAPKNFLITFPPITDDGKQYDDVTVRFTKKHGVWLGAINC